MMHDGLGFIVVEKSLLELAIFFAGKGHLAVALIGFLVCFCVFWEATFSRNFRRANREAAFVFGLLFLAATMLVADVVLNAFDLIEVTPFNERAFVSTLGSQTFRAGSILALLTACTIMLKNLKASIFKFRATKWFFVLFLWSPVLVAIANNGDVWGFLNELNDYKVSGGAYKIEEKIKYDGIAIFIFSFCIYLILTQYTILKLQNWYENNESKKRSGFDRDSLDRFLLFLSIALSIIGSLLVSGADLVSVGIFSGLLGAGISIAFRDFLANIAAGVILYLDNTIKTSDVVELPDGWTGIIRTITLRYTLLEDRNKVEAIIPNSVLIKNQILNYSKTGPRVRLKVQLPTPLGEDFSRIEKIAEQAAITPGRVLKDPGSAPKIFFAEQTHWAVVTEIRFWISTPAGGIANVKSEVRRAVTQALMDEGIYPPRPVLGVNVESNELLLDQEMVTVQN